MISYFAKKDKNLFIDFMFQNTCFVLFFVFLISFFRVLWNFQTDLKMFLISFAWHVIDSRMIWKVFLSSFCQTVMLFSDWSEIIHVWSCSALQCQDHWRYIFLGFVRNAGPVCCQRHWCFLKVALPTRTVWSTSRPGQGLRLLFWCTWP